MITHQVLNPQVQAELAQDFELYLVYRTLHRGYDNEIDPLHNPDMRRRFENEEVGDLQQAKVLLADLKAAFKAL